MKGSNTNNWLIVPNHLLWQKSQQNLQGSLLSSKMTKLLTESEGLVPATGEYTMRYCCTGPGAGSQRTSRLLGVGLYTWIFLASPLTTGERKANAYFSCLFTHATLFITLPHVTLSNRIKSYPLYTAIYTRKHIKKNSPNTKLAFANVESMLFSIKINEYEQQDWAGHERIWD